MIEPRWSQVTCTCTPGTREGGWHEQRCAACLQVEREIWASSLASARKVIDEMVRRRAD